MEFEINISDKFDMTCIPSGEIELIQDLLIHKTYKYISYLESVYDSLIYVVNGIFDDQYEKSNYILSDFVEKFMEDLSNSIIVCESNITGLKNFTIDGVLDIYGLISNLKNNRALWSCYIGSVEQMLYKENLIIN